MNPLKFLDLRSLALGGAELLMAQGRRIAHRAQACVSIAVVDRAGQLITCIRLDHAPDVASELSVRKARTAAQMKVATRNLQKMVDGPHPAYLAAASLCPIAGGFPIMIGTACVGAIGVSGATEDIDHDIASEAAAAFAALCADDP